MIKKKKGFTLIEFIVTIAVLGVLVLLASPRFFGHTQNAELTRGFANAKSIEKASELYYMDNNDWPRLTDEPYTSEEIESYSERIFNHTGHEVNLDPEGNYYDIDYDKLSDYIQVPDDKKNYILQNPVGKVFYMENLSAEGEKRVDYENKMQSNIKTPNKPAINNITDNSAIIDGGSGTEVRIGEGAWHDSPHTFTNLNENTAYTAYSRYKKTDTHYASNVSEGFNFRTNSYEFTATFTNAGSTGRTGPSQSQLDRAYVGTSLEGLVKSQNGTQLWTVPKSGTYRIEAYGAQGGGASWGNHTARGGQGSIIKGNFSLKEGTILKVLVGQLGQIGYQGSGGGGAFVTLTNNTPLIVSGGGGGANVFFKDGSLVGTYNGLNASHTNNQTTSGGTVSDIWFGSGSGLTGNGAGGRTGGSSFKNGGYGGLGGQDDGFAQGLGGFGGGGGQHLKCSGCGAGGGGGYHGGNASKSWSKSGGSGGGSFNSGANQVNSVGNTGHGKVVITYIGE